MMIASSSKLGQDETSHEENEKCTCGQEFPTRQLYKSHIKQCPGHQPVFNLCQTDSSKSKNNQVPKIKSSRKVTSVEKQSSTASFSKVQNSRVKEENAPLASQPTNNAEGDGLILQIRAQYQALAARNHSGQQNPSEPPQNHIDGPDVIYPPPARDSIIIALQGQG